MKATPTTATYPMPMYTTNSLIEKSTAIFSILMAFGLFTLMQSAGYYFEGVRYELDPPHAPEYKIEKSIITNFGLSGGKIKYLKIDTKPSNKAAPQNTHTFSIPATLASSRIRDGLEVDLYFLKKKSIGLTGKSLWRIQENERVIVDEQQMSVFRRYRQHKNFGVAWMTGIIGGILCASAFIYSWRTKIEKQSLVR